MSILLELSTPYKKNVMSVFTMTRIPDNAETDKIVSRI